MANSEADKPRPLEGRTLIVTGAGRGLGREIALALARAGASIVCAARSRAEIEKVAGEIERLGQPAMAVPTDVTSWDEVDALVRAATARFGHVYGMIANAGGGSGSVASSVELIENDAWDATIRLNLTGSFYCAKAVVPHLRAAQEGVIITVSSGNAYRGESRLLAYSAAKAGVVALTKGLATSLAADGIRANCIVPGVMLTAEVAASGRATDVTRRGAYIPAGRVGEGWEIGPLAVFLASDESRYITGEAIEIDGGGLAGGLAPVGWDVVAQQEVVR